VDLQQVAVEHDLLAVDLQQVEMVEHDLLAELQQILPNAEYKAKLVEKVQ